tara:strand:+ start:19 stop:414 length:396 start_codon:yes stop_codon:yes gene_type:complete
LYQQYVDRDEGGKSKDAFRTIKEVSLELNLPQHVLRFWEKKFPQLKPLKRGGNRRYYRRDDINFLLTLKKLLYQDKYTIKGVQKLIKENNLSLSRESYSSKSDKNIDFKTSISEIVLDLQNLRKIISENLK